MNSLTLDKAMELYEILGAHVPEVEDENSNALEFIGKIVKSIKESEEHQRYVDAVMLMADIEWEELKELDSTSVLELFIDGLSINRIVSLKMFCEEIGFGYA
jgi:hypothetical protein